MEFEASIVHESKATQRDPVPFDIICEILAHASSEVRVALSVLNREIALEAGKIIWKSITINNKNTGSFRGLVNAMDRIAHAKEYAKMIRNLRLRAEFPGSVRQQLVEHFAQRLCVALKCTTQLDRLSLKVQDYPHIIIDQLSLHADTFEFRIRQFDCSLPFSSGIVNFLTPQTKLSRFRYEGPKDQTPQDIPLDLFPNLNDVKYPIRDIVRVVQGRPVRHLSVMLRDVGHAQCLIDGIVSSTVPVTSVHVNVREITVYSIVAEKLVQFASSLTSLTIDWHHSVQAQVAHHDPEGLIRSLSRSPSLKYLVWQSCTLVSNVHLLYPERYAPPTLRKVSGKLDRGREYFYERANEDGPWVLKILPAVRTPWWH